MPAPARPPSSPPSSAPLVLSCETLAPSNAPAIAPTPAPVCVLEGPVLPVPVVSQLDIKTDAARIVAMVVAFFIRFPSRVESSRSGRAELPDVAAAARFVGPIAEMLIVAAVPAIHGRAEPHPAHLEIGKAEPPRRDRR